MERGVQLLIVLECILGWFLWPFYLWYEYRQPRRIPYTNDALLNISAVQLAADIRTGKIKSEKVVKSYIKRIREVNPVLNAVSEERFSAALEEARQVDATIASGLHTPEKLQQQFPLFGVPITVKESCGLEGMTQAVGSLARKDVKAETTGETVAHLLKAGAIPLCVTTTPEYCMSWDTNNLVTGRTVNPYNTYRSVGGSSGGEGSLLGAGASLVGVGSDTGGSIRIPAHFNGIFGHKPTGGSVSVKGHFPANTDKVYLEYTVIGPMARYAGDLRLMLKIMTGKNSERLGLDKNIDLSKINVYFMEEASKAFIKTPVKQEIKDAVKKAAMYLRDGCKCNLCDVKFNEIENSLQYCLTTIFEILDDMPNIFQNPKNPKDIANLWVELLKCPFGLSKFSTNVLLSYVLKETNVFISKSKTAEFKVKLANLKQQLEKALGSHGVFLYPTYPTTAFNRTGIATTSSGISYTMLFNLMGFPSTTVPIEFDKNNLPIGIQVVAGKYRDGLCLTVAEELEKRFGGWIPPPTSSPLIQ